MVGEVPSQIPSGADVPNRKQSADLPGVLRQFAKNSCREELQSLGKGGLPRCSPSLRLQ
jgi:hypothetical protein